MNYDFEEVHNYHERRVFEEVVRRSEQYPTLTADQLADVACLALNRLPARYVRYEVDLVFYLTEQERQSNQLALDDAIDLAFNYVAGRIAKPLHGVPPASHHRSRKSS